MEITIIIFSLLFSAFFSGMEIAFFASNKLKIALDKESGSRSEKIIFKFLNNLLKIDQNIKLIIFNEDKHDYLFKLKNKFQINDKNIEVKFVNRYQLNEEINKIDICIFFAKINFSIKASFPTKISEVLLAGKPIICNNFNDDILKLLSRHNIGIIHDFDFSKNQSSIYYEINNLISDKNIILRCRNVAKKELSFSQSIKLYKNIYYN